MYNYKYKPNGTIMLLGGVFAFFAAILILTAVFVSADNRKFKETAVPVSAVISEIKVSSKHRMSGSSGKRKHRSKSYTVYVAYEYEGKSYNENLGFYTSGMSEGDTLSVLIDPDHPSDVRYGVDVAAPVCGGIGGIFGLIGIVFLSGELKRKKLAKKLVDKGLYVLCSEWQEEQANVSVNNVRFHQIRAVYNNGYQRYEFKSAAFDPRKQRLFMPGQAVPVFVDLNANPKKYFIPTVEG